MDDRKKIAQLEADLEEMKKDQDLEMNRLAANMVQIEANLMGEIAKLGADLLDGRERKQELERKIAETKRENDDLKAQLKTQQGLVEARGKICGLETEIQCEQKERSGELTKINSKISQNDDQSTKIGADLKAEIVAERSRKMAKLEADLVDGRKRNRELEMEIAETKRKNDDLEAQLSEPNMEVREGKAKIGELEGIIDALQNKNFDLETQINRTMDLDGWSYWAKTSFWYKVIDQEVTFDEAEAYCAIRKCHLVSIHSQEEHDFVWKLAKTVGSNDAFWIGLKRNWNKGNVFEWTDGSLVDFTNWLEGQPDSNTHALLGSGHGKSFSFPPTNHFRFICKRSSQF
ncbi:unnamed protein product, partial [Mesorhabditis belari]|uniref:C-type lectin domain-containing protein n=1 Tax=Mesorhabditis belari TaxID=2138241 RepID=A0AAF3J4U1_9BILA